MFTKRSIALFTLASALSCAAITPALAQATETNSFDGMTAMAKVDMDKDGMVSKQEFLDMMAKVWDEKMTKSGIKEPRMAAEQWRQFILSMRMAK
jgi:hypothetical protein